MKVLKFEEYINEGLWSKTFDRARTGENRLENKTPIDDYIKTVKWIDMGHEDVLFADVDYGYEDKIKLSINDLKLIVQNLPNSISIMNPDQMRWVEDNGTLISLNDYVGIISKVNKKQIRFIQTDNNLYSGINSVKPGGYLVELNDDGSVPAGVSIEEFKFTVGKKGKTGTFGRMNIVDEDKYDTPTHYIKLVKKK